MENLDNFSDNEEDNDFELKDLLEIIGEYKLFIFFVSLLFLFLINIHLYSQPPIYSSYSIIEVKTSGNKQKKATNDLLQNAFHSNNGDINKEIEILKTYEINKKVIDKINFKVQFFVDKNYKKDEIYGDVVPIKIENIKIRDNSIIGKMIKVTLEKDGYYLEIEKSKKEKLMSKFFKKKLLSMDNDKLNPYSTVIKTKYFNLSIRMVKNTNQKAIYFKLNGSNRSIYESIVNRLTIEQLNKDTPLVKISYEDTVPKRTIDYINSLVNIFIQEEEKNKDKKSNEILDFIEKQLKTVKVKLDNSENKLKNHKVKNNIINLSAQSNVIIGKLSNIEIEISENIIKRMFVNSALKALKNTQDFDSLMAILMKLKNDGISMHLETLNRLKLQEMSMMTEYTNKYPKLIKIRHQIKVVKNSIFQNIKNLKSSVEYKISDLKRQKNKYEQKLLTFPKKEIVQINLESRYDVNSQLYIYLLKKKEENKMINKALSVISDYKIIEKAYVPNSSIEQKRSMTMLSFTFVGFVIAVVIVVIFNKLGSKIKDIRDIKYNKNWLFSMEIPYVKNHKNKRIEVFENPQSLFADSYRKLRSDLEFILKSNKSNIVLVSSTMPKEGKSRVVVNLGAIFQLSGVKKTILIDLDLKRPVLNEYFDIEYGIGISSYLDGSVNMSDIVFPTTRPNLDIIPVGGIPINPSELLLSDRLDTLLIKLKKEYDYIFINSPSITTSSDALSLVKYSDINLFVLKRGFSKKKFITKLRGIVMKYNLHNFGLIMNDSIKKEIDYA